MITYFPVWPQLEKPLKQSSLDLGPFSVQLIRLNNIDHLDLRISKETRKAESDLCVVSEKKMVRSLY